MVIPGEVDCILPCTLWLTWARTGNSLKKGRALGIQGQGEIALLLSPL